eukprot:8747616-Alexandrium_andersonii.AAC.1
MLFLVHVVELRVQRRPDLVVLVGVLHAREHLPALELLEVRALEEVPGPQGLGENRPIGVDGLVDGLERAHHLIFIELEVCE